MKQGMDALRGLRYNLRMIDTPISSPSCIYGHNMSVVHDTLSQEFGTLKEEQLVCYHAVCDSVAMGKSLAEHVSAKKKSQI